MSTTRNAASAQVGTTEPEYRLDEPLDPDYAGLYRAIPAADREYLDRARSFVRQEVLPVIAGQFGRPLAASQLVQDRLARMLAELTQLQTLVFRFTELDERGELGGAQAAIAKVTATRTARSLAADARDLLGGNGILLEHRVFRHLADIESLHTYEGTESVQSLIIGRDITGISAFA